MMKHILLTILLAGIALPGIAAAEETANEEPPPPLKQSLPKRRDARPGWLAASDGRVLVGQVFTTRGKPVTIYDRAHKQYFRFEWADVARFDIAIETDIVEQDWRWKEGGSDVKVYTDLWYVWHKYISTLTLRTGEAYTGDLTAPIYIRPERIGLTVKKENEQVLEYSEPEQPTEEQFILHRRAKGDKAAKEDATPPVYLLKVVLTDVPEAEPPPEEQHADGDEEEIVPDQE